MLELHLAADAGKDGLFGGLVRQFLLVEEVKDVVAAAVCIWVMPWARVLRGEVNSRT